MDRHLTVLLVFALSAGLSPAGQGRPATVVGVVRDTSGGLLPGVTLTVALETTEFKAVTDSQGRFSLLLPAGSHTIRATLAGFCDAEKLAVVTPGANASIDLDLKLGPLGEISWIAPPERLSDLIAAAHTVAYVRVTATRPTGECEQSAPVTASVIEAVKPGRLAAGATLTFWQEQWHSERTPYPVGTELAVVLMEWNGKLVRSNGPHAVFPVADGKIRASQFLFYRGYIGMPLAQFLAELRTMVR